MDDSFSMVQRKNKQAYQMGGIFLAVIGAVAIWVVPFENGIEKI